MKIEVIRNGRKKEVKNDDKSKGIFSEIDKKFDAYFYIPESKRTKNEHKVDQ